MHIEGPVAVDHIDDWKITAYYLIKDGYIKITNNPSSEAVYKDIEEAWELWDEYARKRFNINDEEMINLEIFLGL